jgi:hypothetical protein
MTVLGAINTYAELNKRIQAGYAGSTDESFVSKECGREERGHSSWIYSKGENTDKKSESEERTQKKKKRDKKKKPRKAGVRDSCCLGEKEKKQTQHLHFNT